MDEERAKENNRINRKDDGTMKDRTEDIANDVKDASVQEHMEHIQSEDNEEKEKKDAPGYGKDIRDMLIYFVLIVGAVLLIHNFVGQQIEVSGSSMESTLHDEDHLILEKISYEAGNPKRFDIIVFRPYADEKDTYYIKRIIGMPGETVQIIGSDIYINGEILNEDYGNALMEDAGIAAEPITLGQEEYFVLGDNRNNSKDSRNPSVGIINRKSILGRAWVRIWPLNDLGVLPHQ